MSSRQLSLVLAILVTLNGCTSWRAESVAPAQLVSQRHPKQVRARRSDGQKVILRQPLVRGDSLLGLAGRDTTGLALNEVDSLEIKRVDGGKTAALVIFTAGVLFAVSYVVASSAYSGFTLGY
jgi:hypothetical protein